MTDPIAFAALIGGTFLLAGVVKGVIGLGLPTVAMGVLGLAMRPVEAASLLIVPSLVTNIWQLAAGPGVGPLLRRLWPMLAGIVLGTLAGAGVIAGSGARGATAALGGALVLYAAAGLTRPAVLVPARVERWAGPLVGGVTGLVTGATGVFVIPAVPYLGSLGFGRDELVQALGLSFTASTVALAAGLALHGAMPAAFGLASVLALAPALLGMALGGWLRARVRPAVFRAWFFGGLLLLGGELLWRGLS